MKAIAQKDLLADLESRTLRVLEQAQKLAAQPIEKLNKRPHPSSWSALECLAHLNLYSAFYLPEISQKMDKSTFPSAETFTSSWLGNYFAKSMLPRADKPNKMKTFKSMNPIGSALTKDVITQFIADQNQMLDLLHTAADHHLTKVKTGITISNWIKLRLGDTFRVVIYHNQRHLIQALKAADCY